MKNCEPTPIICFIIHQIAHLLRSNYQHQFLACLREFDGTGHPRFPAAAVADPTPPPPPPRVFTQQTGGPIGVTLSLGAPVQWGCAARIPVVAFAPRPALRPLRDQPRDPPCGPPATHAGKKRRTEIGGVSGFLAHNYGGISKSKKRNACRAVWLVCLGLAGLAWSGWSGLVWLVWLGLAGLAGLAGLPVCLVCWSGWSAGRLVCWLAGLLVGWSGNLPVCWSLGLLVCRSAGFEPGGRHG